MTETKPTGSTKLPATVSLAIGILVFFLPFVDVRCNSLSLQKVTGFELATGFKVKSGNDGSLVGSLESMRSQGTQVEVDDSNRRSANVFALIALALGVLGIAFSFINSPMGAKALLVSATLATASLIALAIDLKAQVRNELLTLGEKQKEDVVITVNMAAGFYLAVIAFGAAAFLGMKRGPEKTVNPDPGTTINPTSA